MKLANIQAELETINADMTGMLEAADNREKGERGFSEADQTRFNNLKAERGRLKTILEEARSLKNDPILDGDGDIDGVEDRGEMPWEIEQRRGRQTGRKAGHDDLDPDVLAERQQRDGSISMRCYNPDTQREETISLREDDPRRKLALLAYNESFRQYMRTGDTEDRSTLSIAVGDKGGNIAPMQVANRFIQNLDNMNYMRQFSNTISLTEGGSLGVFGIETDPSDAEWTSEIRSTNVSADSSTKTSRRELKPSLLIKHLAMSKTLMNRMPGFVDIVRERLAYVTAKAEENAFLNGNGDGQPLGVFKASAAGVPTSRDVDLGSSTDLTTDGLIKVYMNLKAGHRRNASWILSRLGIEKAMLLKDSEGRYIWRPGLTDDRPETIMSRPVLESEYAPNTFTASKYVVACANLDFYQIVTALNLSILSDPYSLSRQNKHSFVVYHESDGMPVLAEAFSRGKTST